MHGNGCYVKLGRGTTQPPFPRQFSGRRKRWAMRCGYWRHPVHAVERRRRGGVAESARGKVTRAGNLNKKFAEPVSLSSTAFADLPLPGSAFELGFDLLGSRARRKRQSRGWARSLQGCPDTQRPQFAEIQFSTFPQQTVQLVEKSRQLAERVQSARAAPPPARLPARRRLLHLGARVRALPLARNARGRDLGRDVVHPRRGLRLSDLPSRADVRDRRASPSARSPRARTLTDQREQQSPRELRTGLLP
jgi:hypothetical protein